MSLVVEVLPSLQCLRSHDLSGHVSGLLFFGTVAMTRHMKEITALAQHGFHESYSSIRLGYH